MGLGRGARRRAAAIGIVLAGASAADARAATVELGTTDVSGQEVRYLGAVLRDGAADRLSVLQQGPWVSFSVFLGGDRFEGPLPAGCAFSATAVYDQQVDCDLTRTAPVDAIAAAGLGGADTLDASADPDASLAVPFLAFGGDGEDTITGGRTLDVIDAGRGADDLRDSAGPDVLLGGDGDDAFFSGRNDDEDVLDGGPGADTATFRRGTTFRVSLDGQANDGVAGEGDDVRVEHLEVEGSGATFVGDDGPNVLRNSFGGGEGGRANRFEGGGGADRLLGAGGTDELIGGEGDDELVGGDDSDLLDGGGGTDTFVGDTRSARFEERPGDDVVLARDGVQETISCGLGADRAQVDAADVVAVDLQNGCEVVDRPQAGGGGGGPAGGGPSGGGPSGGGPSGGGPAGGGAPGATVPLGARGVGLRATRRDRRAPFVFRVAGRLDAPAGRCAGARVRVRALRGRRAVRTATAVVRADCRWKARLRLRRRGRYALRVTFLGGPQLTGPAVARGSLRAG